MQHTNINGYKTFYQKDIATSARVGYAARSMYASSGSWDEGIPTNNQKGRRDLYITFDLVTFQMNLKEVKMSKQVSYPLKNDDARYESTFSPQEQHWKSRV